MKACPFALAYNRNTPTWLVSRRPAVPLYCRATPADFFPFFTKPVSSTTSTPLASPRCLVLTQRSGGCKLERVDSPQKGKGSCKRSNEPLHENLSKKRSNWCDRAT